MSSSSPAAVGFLLAFASAVCNGSFAAFQKLPQVQRSKPHPIIFNMYVSLGVVVSSLVVIPFLPLIGLQIKFNPLGSLAGALFVLATLFSFLAIPYLGLAMAQGTWGGAALLASFLWGVLGPSPVGLSPRSLPGSLFGVALLIVGVIGMVYHAEIARLVCCIDQDNEDGTTSEEDILLETGEQGREPEQNSKRSSFLVGLIFALCVGLFGGSVNVPSELTKKYGIPLEGLETMPSFGLGTLCMGLVVPTFYFKLIDPDALVETGGLHFRAISVPGLISGTIWNIGNVCSVYANSIISFAIAQPLMQCALLVSGMLGIFVFKEIVGRGNILTFFSFAVVLLTGAALLAVYGPSV